MPFGPLLSRLNLLFKIRMLDREDRIIDINIEDEMKTAYIDYSMSVIVSRALPDVRDGFKPVHRRVLYAMNEDGNTYDKPTRKCASAVGQVMKYYHPHGGLLYLWDACTSCPALEPPLSSRPGAGELRVDRRGTLPLRCVTPSRA